MQILDDVLVPLLKPLYLDVVLGNLLAGLALEHNAVDDQLSHNGGTDAHHPFLPATIEWTGHFMAAYRAGSYQSGLNINSTAAVLVQNTNAVTTSI